MKGRAINCYIKSLTLLSTYFIFDFSIDLFSIEGLATQMVKSFKFILVPILRKVF